MKDVPLLSDSSGVSLLDALLREQRELTAVERFSDRATANRPLGGYYRDLMPVAPPGPGQQYAFEVDLDSCTGCKACVTACHTLNGLDDTESWRSVGLLTGQSTSLPVIQHVTTSCHHCLDPACMTGCPVRAYEKDPRTGIVRHLDDQCIGCQYCVLACPYDAPRYNKDKGIVRKCDMCSDRLAADLPPACVQACPNGAIRIRVVDVREIAAGAESSRFLPGAPDPGQTLPTTRYQTARELPSELLPADYFEIAPEHGHPALVFMLVFTQLAVGGFVIDAMTALLSSQGLWPILRPTLPMLPLALGGLGMGAAVFHLGRPLYAFRAILGLRTSWLSREIVAFGVFWFLTWLYASLLWSLPDRAAGGRLLAGLELAASATGLFAVYCSARIYSFTGRPYWNAPMTCLRFFLTTAILGLSAFLLTSVFWNGGESTAELRQQFSMIGAGLAVLTLCKLGLEGSYLAYLWSERMSPLKRTAMLLTGPLAAVTLRRFLCGIAGGVLLPLLIASSRDPRPEFVVLATALALVLLVLGELFERYLFFAAVVAPRMPRGVGQ